VGVIAEVVRRVDGRIPVIGGTGANATAEAIELTRAASDVGVDACLLVTPYYNKPTQEGLYRHFRAVAEAVPIPQILYNVPGRTACDLQLATVLRLADVPNIVGLKDATGSLERGAELLAQCPPDFWLFSGEDAIAAELMLRGYRGVISVTANVAPRAMAAMSEAALAGNREQALALDAPLQALHRDLFVEANPIPVKWALAELELIEPGIRLPLTPLSAACHDTVRAALRQASLL
ncbi:MAG TPA: 4-hydroxy-tetrahydrodipicolinate synthase, partial [Immundisolibacter sp.]